jgi:hypothetical protein
MPSQAYASPGSLPSLLLSALPLVAAGAARAGPEGVALAYSRAVDETDLDAILAAGRAPRCVRAPR